MTVTSAQSEAIDQLATSFGGRLLRAADPGYDAARKVHNGLIDKHPMVVARCTGTADIAAAVSLARQLGLDIAVRGGGHNVSGNATVQGGMMIDLSPMKAVLVDAKARTAWAQGGVTWGEFNRETQLHGLATTGGVVSSTGVAGLTLGGGLGWLMAKHGLALDNLLAAEVVTAEAKVIRASADENADLFWALRGGGGNFGVVSAFQFRLHPVGPMVTGGLVAHPFEKARDVMHFYRDFTRSLPDEMMAFMGLVHAPDGSGTKLAALVVCHCGDAAAAEAALGPVKAFGPPVMDAVGPIPYSALNGMLDGGFPKGALNYWKSSFLRTLSDAAIDAMIACFAKCPSPMSKMLLEHFHGAACRVKPDATAFPHRDESYNLAILSQWMDPSATAACTRWAKESHDAMAPFMTAGRYVNYLGDDENQSSVSSAYGGNFARLRQVKAKYDPGNVFHINQNIPPAA